MQTDPAGRVVAGLCDGWSGSNGFRVWDFRCTHALEIAAELRRVARLRASPAYWIFASATRITVPTPGVVRVQLPFAWRRFPYALTTTAAAPRHVPGPFRLVTASRNAVELERDGMHVIFRRLGPLALLRAVRRGDLDEASLPLGDAGDFDGSPTLRVRPLLAIDVVAFRRGVTSRALRRAYWDTANRADYQALVAEDGASAAFAIVGGAPAADPSAFRRALQTIKSLPPKRVRIAVPSDPVLQYGARLLYAQWREAGLGPQLVGAGAPADARFFRDAAVYPQQEALLAPLHLSAAIGIDDQRTAFRRLGAQLRRTALVIPVCWVADARWVSPRLRGWREDALGNVDYTRISLAG